mmetsp:Transcript_19513/g.49598  ORF Transcript_19513/g.49598 Transcript_19513/m.49598 type:complete len:115 (-) Transcript_19513:21-365(-)
MSGNCEATAVLLSEWCESALGGKGERKEERRGGVRNRRGSARGGECSRREACKAEAVLKEGSAQEGRRVRQRQAVQQWARQAVRELILQPGAHLAHQPGSAATGKAVRELRWVK